MAVDVMNTGTIVSMVIGDEGVEFREPLIIPSVESEKMMPVPPKFNIVAMAWVNYDDPEAWVNIMAANPEYLYPPDLERAVGQSMRVPR